MHGTLPVSNPAAMPVHRRAAAGSNFFRWASSSAVAFTRGFMRCRKCGYTNPDNMRFCWACNENLNNPKYLNSFDYECIPSFFSNAILWAFLIASILLSFDKLLLIHIPFDGRDANPYFYNRIKAASALFFSGKMNTATSPLASNGRYSFFIFFDPYLETR